MAGSVFRASAPRSRGFAAFSQRLRLSAADVAGTAENPVWPDESYGNLAKKLGSSAWALGSAVGRNPLSIIIPCHRVLGADGSLTGYAGGLENKEKLLKLEEIYVDKERRKRIED